MNLSKPILGILLLLALVPSLRAEEALGYYRYPAIHGDTVVFAAEGDLWRVGRQGGTATRLTTHPAEEAFPAISPETNARTSARLMAVMRLCPRAGRMRSNAETRAARVLTRWPA